jgi:hypothetical protein
MGVSFSTVHVDQFPLSSCSLCLPACLSSECPSLAAQQTSTSSSARCCFHEDMTSGRKHKLVRPPTCGSMRGHVTPSAPHNALGNSLSYFTNPKHRLKIKTFSYRNEYQSTAIFRRPWGSARNQGLALSQPFLSLIVT